MADVKVLVIGTSRAGWQKGRKGDIWAITPGDFGTAETSPDWLQLTVTDVPGTQSEATALVEQYIESIGSGFVYSEVAGAGTGEQRYRVESAVGAVPNPIFLAIRNGIVNSQKFGAGGNYVNQSPRTWFEFDGYEGVELVEIEYEAGKAAQDSRRYAFSDNYVDNILGGVPQGDPASDTQTWTWFQANIEDKLG